MKRITDPVGFGDVRATELGQDRTEQEFRKDIERQLADPNSILGKASARAGVTVEEIMRRTSPADEKAFEKQVNSECARLKVSPAELAQMGYQRLILNGKPVLGLNNRLI